MKKSLEKQCEELEIGEYIDLPIQKIKSARQTAYITGLIYKRKYMTRCDKENDIVRITRVK